MPAPNAPGDFDLTMDELREITRYVAESAAQVQDIFQRAHPEDPRVGAAIDVAQEFIRGGPRNRRQRSASLEAHRAAKDASTEAAWLAARAAGDAASAAYLHPIAKAHQVGHILRAAACAARIAELNADDDPAAGARAIEDAATRATPALSKCSADTRPRRQAGTESTSSCPPWTRRYERTAFQTPPEWERAVGAVSASRHRAGRLAEAAAIMLCRPPASDARALPCPPGLQPAGRPHAGR